MTKLVFVMSFCLIAVVSRQLCSSRYKSVVDPLVYSHFSLIIKWTNNLRRKWYTDSSCRRFKFYSTFFNSTCINLIILKMIYKNSSFTFNSKTNNDGFVIIFVLIYISFVEKMVVRLDFFLLIKIFDLQINKEYIMNLNYHGSSRFCV